uniref:ZP domain-containing protein n=1 Tax=Steinernema glaseri TaxID=37863 RepID=A0A1I7ZC36_9BILA
MSALTRDSHLYSPLSPVVLSPLFSHLCSQTSNPCIHVDNIHIHRKGTFVLFHATICDMQNVQRPAVQRPVVKTLKEKRST